MKKLLLTMLTSIILLTGCKTNEIDLYNSVLTPDLDNPVIQKITNQTWYNDHMNLRVEWGTVSRMEDPSYLVQDVLYSFALRSFVLNRDGTATFSYVPPPMFFPNLIVIFRHGLWKVSTTEENTVIIETATPVSKVIFKLQILNFETKENIAVLNSRWDLASRVIRTRFINNISDTSPYPEDILKEALDYNNIRSLTPLRTALKENEFIASWNTHDFDDDNQIPMSIDRVIRMVNIDNLLLNTPPLITGLQINLMENNKAAFVYKSRALVKFEPDENTPQLNSKAKWHIKDNKIIIESDEYVFFAYGQIMFGLSLPHKNRLTLKEANPETGTQLPTIIWKKYKMILELIERKDDGYFFRVTTSDNQLLYLFLTKEESALQGSINVMDLKE